MIIIHGHHDHCRVAKMMTRILFLNKCLAGLFLEARKRKELLYFS